MAAPDDHVHSEWSWDTTRGSMERTCARAVELGLPSVAFTEHADFTPWTTADVGSLAHLGIRPGPDGVMLPPPLDVEGYLACVRRCRDRFPGLRILAGVELGEPHWHPDRAADLLGRGFDRVLGSLHSIRAGDGLIAMEADAYGKVGPAELIRRYLAEVGRMVRTSDAFQVLAHVDYPLRSWPAATAGPFDPTTFEEEYRDVLAALAASGRVLEVNTRVPLDPAIVDWWHQAGGDAISFGSDAHDPESLANGFPAAEAMAAAHGFRPGRRPHDLWVRA